MMFEYVNTHPLTIQEINVADLATHIGWWSEADEWYSAIDVLENHEKYRDDYDRIINANLDYPCIFHDQSIVDGCHRIAKTVFLEKQDTIKCFIFDDELMSKFVVGDYK